MIIVFIKQTLTWLSAAKGNTLFKVTATNSCGQTTGCFQLRACVNNCTYILCIDRYSTTYSWNVGKYW